MDIEFLAASIPLTKTYVLNKSGNIEKHPYPNAYEFTSTQLQVPDMKSFAAAITKHAALGHTLLKGNLGRPLNSESRKGSTDSNGVTEWIVLDIDGLSNINTVDRFLKAVGLDDVSHVVQYSASYGIENTDLRAHVFMQLSRPMAAPLLKQWLMELNHRTPELNNELKLTKTGNSLSWALDVTACQNDKLIYIAPPLLKGGIKDPFATTGRSSKNAPQRISYVARAKTTLNIAGTIATAEQNKSATLKKVDDLRQASGLPARKWSFISKGPHQILSKPDNATVSEIKTDRGYVYFNLNGGDSWAYYHPEDNPDYIFNFKGEPTYLTKELLPDYWEQITQSSSSHTNSQGLNHLAFLDRKTSTYYRGTYNGATDVLDLNAAKNETQVRHFAKQNGVPLGDFIPEWDLVFDPHAGLKARVDHAAKRVNTYEPSEFGKSKARKVTVVPPVIHKVIFNALGSDQAVYDHFLNWLACIFQYRTRTLTAWVLHGTEGTGKGMLMTKIIRPLLGTKQTASRQMEDLNEKYNHWMQNCFVVFIDEIEAKALANEKGVAARMRNWITEPTITIRAMNVGGYEADNHMNMILASNKPDPVVIDEKDRRHNIAVYQPNKLVLTDKELDKLDTELQAFHDFMMSYKADRRLAATVLDTADRRELISISQTSIDVAVANTQTGNFDFFLDQLPNNDNYKRNALTMNKVTDYIETLLHVLDRTDPKTGACNIPRDELHIIFGYTVGNLPETPNKFTSMLKHHRVHMTKVWVDGKAVQGIKVTWNDTSRFAEFREVLAPTVAKPKLKSVGGKK